MPHYTSHIPGSFCLFELSAHNQAVAKQFYTSLFGWQTHDNPDSPTGVYTMFSQKGPDNVGRAVAGAYTQFKMQTDAGFPPYWDLYVAVADADAAAAKAVELGGKIAMPAFDVAAYGRMAVIVDPTGAPLCLWQARTLIGVGIKNEPGSFCWADLASPDPEKAAAFYGGLLGWTVDAGKSDYLHIKNADEFIGGVRAAGPGERAHWLSYVQVSNCDETAAKARELGAKIVVAPRSVGESGRMCVLADPQGAVFALFELA